MRKHLEELASGRPNDANRWGTENSNAAHIFRILLHLEWAEAHPQSLGFQRPEALSRLDVPAARTTQDGEEVEIQEQRAPLPDVVDLDDFVSLEDHLDQVCVPLSYTQDPECKVSWGSGSE